MTETARLYRMRNRCQATSLVCGLFAVLCLVTSSVCIVLHRDILATCLLANTAIFTAACGVSAWIQGIYSRELTKRLKGK